MKHQVFFFLSIFSFSAYSMDHNAINKLTNEQIVDALTVYCSTFPDFVNKNEAKKEMERIRTAALTFKDKREIVKKMQQFPCPDIVMIGDRAVLFERDGYEAKSVY